MRDGVFVADAHTHIFTRPSRLYGREVEYSAEALIESMDLYGVDFSLVIARPTSQLDLDALKQLHDETAQGIAGYAERLRAFCWGIPRLGNQGVAEVERCWDELGYIGLKLHPVHEQFLLDDPDSLTLIEAADRRRVPVMVHTDSTVEGAEPWRLLFVAQDFPSTTFVMAHVGGNGSEVQNLSIVRLAAVVDNVVLDVSTTVTDPAATYLEPARILGPERVCYGSNSPIHPMAPNLLTMELL
ncbi:amidohydrolase family protein [soil metagenome]